ncbi:toll/interleukin-1 receptor domain-containing protein [Ancylomarina sp. DW003]|nr:toll/interleukin-1 receptor domain-containing protein [Ancylomarina sp. DW003]MDE5420988.1 toll/interleukin-1 receptor domain-containing protein [Ancylomarina sp. DW003]
MIFERGYFDNNLVTEDKIEKSLRDVKNFSAYRESSTRATVFLSHKHDDLKDLRGVVGMLEDLGAKVYIDSMDNKMPEETNGDTAHRIKDVIKGCKKFVLLATDKAIESYWCNWELGIGDTHRYIDNIAVLAMKDRGTYDHNFKGNEYLQIYPAIIFHEKGFNNRWGNYIEPGFWVRKPMNSEGVTRITKLDEWLKQ